ncbi:MAG: PVC-type heme-binding CxxCH protein [Verrucomicrobiota bacterium]
MNPRSACLALAALLATLPVLAGSAAVIPKAADGRPLNLDFETGDLRDWTAEGEAFAGQPIRGDTVRSRRADMTSGHEGQYWIGGYEKVGDDAVGTLTSAAFPVTHRWASFRFAGGSWPATRLELVEAATGQAFFQVSGLESETLRPMVVDLQERLGQAIRVRLVDRQKGHWGHVNFDGFALHADRPRPAQELTLAEVKKQAPPPADEVPFAGLTAEQACAKVTLPPGFKMHPFAAEPEIVQPIAFCDDHRGRIWVAEGRSYPRRQGRPPAGQRPAGSDPTQPTPDQLKDIFGGRDRILVLEDTDGDHRADRKTVFLENVNLVSGLEVGFGGVWIGAAPYLLFVPVQDGDQPRPAGDPRIVLDGWDYTFDTHETLNTFTWGPDGWLYGCHGVFCPSHVGRPGTPAEKRQWMDAGTWRYHPVKEQFEVFTEGGSNPWGIDFDEHGNLWSEMCVIPHLFHMIQGARITRQGGEHFAVGPDETARSWRHRQNIGGRPKAVFPHVYEDIGYHADHLHYAGNQGPHAANGRSDASGGGHAHAGMMCYLGTSWPAEYRGRLLLGNIHGQRLNADLPEPAGSGYLARHGPDFLNFNDRWSQTLHQRLDPDGSMTVIDWYDQNQCHHNREDGHDRGNGRIYRVVYNGQKKTPVDLEAKSDAELVQLVGSRNEWMSRHARRLLQERVALAGRSVDPGEVPEEWAAVARVMRAGREKAALGDLRAQVDSNAPTPARLRALWALHLTGTLRMEDAGRWVTDPDPWVRAWTVQLFFENAPQLFADPGRMAEVQDRAVESLARLAREDASPVVRRFVASALQRLPAERRWNVLTALLSRAEDAGDRNLPLLYWYAAEGAVAQEPDRATELLKACRIPKVRQFIARRLAAGAVADGRP